MTRFSLTSLLLSLPYSFSLIPTISLHPSKTAQTECQSNLRRQR
uniref:Uncharacterized protein n=1 Tax=Rhizophora mucronata TaxID=61149 RepID=A0A2P2Q9A1_RHIMU